MVLQWIGLDVGLMGNVRRFGAIGPVSIQSYQELKYQQNGAPDTQEAEWLVHEQRV